MGRVQEIARNIYAAVQRDVPRITRDWLFDRPVSTLSVAKNDIASGLPESNRVNFAHRPTAGRCSGVGLAEYA